MFFLRPTSRAMVFAFGLLGLAACADLNPTAPDPTAASLTTSTGATLVECPSNVNRAVTGTVGLTGGSLSLDGTSIIVPAGAVLLPTELTLTLPASNYMEVRITANGAEHFDFHDVVTIRIDYSRCTRSNIDKATLSAWYFNPATGALLEDMGGTDDKVASTVTFGTDHLSAYAIAD